MGDRERRSEGSSDEFAVPGDSSRSSEDGVEQNPDQLECERRVRQGDEQALAAFLETNRDALIRFIRTISSDRLRSVVEVDDLFQEVCSAALSGLQTAPLDEYSPWQWLQQIARRRVVDAHRFHFEAKRRDAGRRQSIDGDAKGDDGGGIAAMLAASMTSPSAAFSRDVRVMRMHQAVEALAEDAKLAVKLRYGSGLPTKEIAERMGKSDAAIRVLLSRSLRALEKKLSDVRPSR